MRQSTSFQSHILCESLISQVQHTKLSFPYRDQALQMTNVVILHQSGTLRDTEPRTIRPAWNTAQLYAFAIFLCLP